MKTYHVLFILTFAASALCAEIIDWKDKRGNTLRASLEKTYMKDGTICGILQPENKNKQIQVSEKTLGEKSAKKMKHMFLDQFNAPGAIRGDIEGNFLNLLKTRPHHVSDNNWPRWLFPVSGSYTVTSSRPRLNQPYVWYAVLIEKKDSTRMLLRPHSTGARYSLNRKELDTNKFKRNNFSTKGEICEYTSKNSEPKVILWRCELWCNGVLIDLNSNSSEKLLSRYDIPKDWYTHKKGIFNN